MPKKQPLSITHPELSKEWHPTKNKPLTPKDVTYGMGKKVWWVCKKGHDFLSSLLNRSNGRGCPYCANRKVGFGNDLKSVNPKLAAQWHPTNNGQLKPSDVIAGGHKVIWWKCPKGDEHEWHSKIRYRMTGDGCPYCSGKRVSKTNNLKNLYPEIAKQWNHKKNINLRPTDLTAHSLKKVWWQCEKEHEWVAPVSNRTSGNNCPYCANQLVGYGNDLATLYPDISKQWYSEKNGDAKPSDVVAGSAKTVWWKCLYGEDHVWKQKVSHRTNGSGCPFCSGRKASKQYSFFTENPKASDEWHPLKNGKLKPYEISPNHGNKVWWICKRGHEWQATPNGRMRGRGCPHCHSKTSAMELMVYSEIKWIFDEVYLRKKVFNQECDVFIPELPLAIEIDGVFWHKDKRKKDKLKNKVLSDNSIQIIRLREANLPKIENHDIIYEYGTDELPPIIKLVEFINIYFNLSKNKRINSYLGDKVLKNEKFFMELLDRLPDPLPGTSLMELNPNLVKEWHTTKNGNLTPDKITPGSGRKIWWECNKGHEWTATSAARTGKKKTGCPFCTHQKVGYGNDLASSYPDIAKQWNYLKNGNISPSEVIAGGKRQYWWVCKNKHEWKASTGKRIAGRNCPYCANRVVGYGNDLKSNYPDIAAQWNYKKNNILPDKILPHSGKKYWWVCEKNHEWETSSDKRLNGRGCPYCANRMIGYGNDLQTLYPEIANQWHPTKNGNLEPSKVVPGSAKKVWWTCETGHEWQAMVHVRAIRGDGKCKECKK